MILDVETTAGTDPRRAQKGARTRVLFVDDEPGILELLQLSLESMNGQWEIAFKPSAEEALNLFNIKPFDIVVSDMRMPRMTGAQLLNEVMKRSPATARVILSAYADE